MGHRQARRPPRLPLGRTPAARSRPGAAQPPPPLIRRRGPVHAQSTPAMKLTILELCLVVLVGPSGCGKSTFARKHFKPTEVISSDFCRGLVSDEENNQAATKDAFEVLHFIAAKRLTAGRLTVVDATNVQTEARKPLVELARRHHVIPVAIVLNISDR